MWKTYIKVPQVDGTTVTVKVPKLYADITLLTHKDLLRDVEEVGVKLRRRGKGVDEKTTFPPGKEAKSALRAVLKSRA